MKNRIVALFIIFTFLAGPGFSIHVPQGADQNGGGASTPNPSREESPSAPPAPTAEEKSKAAIEKFKSSLTNQETVNKILEGSDPIEDLKKELEKDTELPKEAKDKILAESKKALDEKIATLIGEKRKENASYFAGTLKLLGEKGHEKFTNSPWGKAMAKEKQELLDKYGKAAELISASNNKNTLHAAALLKNAQEASTGKPEDQKASDKAYSDLGKYFASGWKNRDAIKALLDDSKYGAGDGKLTNDVDLKNFLKYVGETASLTLPENKNNKLLQSGVAASVSRSAFLGSYQKKMDDGKEYWRLINSGEFAKAQEYAKEKFGGVSLDWANVAAQNKHQGALYGAIAKFDKDKQSFQFATTDKEGKRTLVTGSSYDAFLRATAHLNTNGSDNRTVSALTQFDSAQIDASRFAPLLGFARPASQSVQPANLLFPQIINADQLEAPAKPAAESKTVEAKTEPAKPATEKKATKVVAKTVCGGGQCRMVWTTE